ncbi:GDYXXLXY domain-containing protein [Fusobacterium sp. MFO224]|uniref:GDYXXLXY domain-containing protein n=1 Tax=Fusobacterium sp. MFO224 TaxID=3378070 RepID=UPI003854AE66
MKKILVLLNISLLIVYFGYSINIEKSNLKKDSFYLELLPVDPRSLIQGDYMKLSYKIVNDSYKDIYNLKEGYIKISIDNKNIGHYMNVETLLSPLSNNEKLIYFNQLYNGLDIGINSYLFQEGKGYLFQKAKYAEVIISKNKKLRVKHLLDNNFKTIK